MNIQRGCTRLIGVCIATATLSSPLVACTANPDTKETLTVADLQPIQPEDEYAKPYDLKAKIGKCTLVTYSYQLGGDIPVMQRTVYEYVLYAPNGTTRISDSRDVTREFIENMMNHPQTPCLEM